MQKIALKKTTSKGNLLEATFLPEKGMNLISYKRDEIEVIEQSTWGIFEERFAGLGALIGPHFHRRSAELVPKLEDESLFPHIARVKAKGVQDPFSHGIARYAPWKVEAFVDKLKAVLSGKDEWNGIPLRNLEGQNFKMQLEVELHDNGLHLDLSVVSDTCSLVGIHYYYALPDGKGLVTSRIQNRVRINGDLELVPENWNIDDGQVLKFDLDQEADYTFRPYPDPLSGKILLETEKYHLHTHYSSDNEENSWQLYHPKGASFVCIEPLSSQDPRRPNLTVSRLKIHLEILKI